MTTNTTVALALVLLCIQYASCSRCVTTNGTQCCGLQVSGFGGPDLYAVRNGYWAAENLTVCWTRITSSEDQFRRLVAGEFDFVSSHVDNAIFRRLNLGQSISILSGGDGSRGYYLLGNTINLNGYNSPAALSNKTILVDSNDSGFIPGLVKILKDYDVKNYTFQPVGSVRLPPLQTGVANGQTAYATLLANTSPYQVTYPVVPLARLVDYLCPAQASGYIAYTSWLSNTTNQSDLRKFFRGILRSYIYQTDPANRNIVLADIQTTFSVSNTTAIFIYNDQFNNPASGIDVNLTLKRLGVKNLISVRLDQGLSPYPAEPVDSYIADKPGGLVDMTIFRDAQASLGLTNDYSTNPGIQGCPYKNTGVVVTVPDNGPFNCSVSYNIITQPPAYPTGTQGELNITVSDPSGLVTPAGQPGWSITFSAAFSITNIYNAQLVSQSGSGPFNYVLSNPSNYNQQNPNKIGWIATTTLAAPGNNICGVKINNVLCSVATPNTASFTC